MRNRFVFLLLFAASVGLLLSPVFQRFIREAVVIPLLYLIWIARFFLSAVPHSALWSCYVVFLLLVMGLSLVTGRRKKRTLLQPDPDNRGRLENLADLIRQAEQDDYFKWRLAQQLQKLSLEMIAFQTGQSTDAVRQQLRQGTLAVPAELQRYFAAGLKPLGSVVAPRSRFSTRRTATALDLDPAQVVQFLESDDSQVDPVTEESDSQWRDNTEE